MSLISFGIVTRYNVRSPFAKGFDVNDRQWLEGRRVLFEKYCAPSVRAQTDQDFRWFVFVNEDMPADEAARLEEIGGCEIIYCASQTDGINKIQESVTSGRSMVLTTRLDSDDTIAPTYVETMRAMAERNAVNALAENQGVVLCMGNGAEHDTGADQWFDRYYANNPFIGFLEPVVAGKPARMIFHHAHYDMCRHYDSVTIKTAEPMWCIRVHGGNVANQVKGEPRATAPAALAAVGAVAAS